jgi:hypothetical protein
MLFVTLLEFQILYWFLTPRKIIQQRPPCELNFIEFFWGAVKKYLWEYCDYTFKTLKANLLKALESVQLSTIWKWEHWMIQWMEAYRDEKSSKDAQFDVKKYGSRQYTSHSKALETKV